MPKIFDTPEAAKDFGAKLEQFGEWAGSAALFTATKADDVGANVLECAGEMIKNSPKTHKLLSSD